MSIRFLSDHWALVAVLLLPLLVAVFRQKQSQADGRDIFLLNLGQNGYWATIAGAIGGNIGIGTFIALFLFTSQSPVLGFSIAAAYGVGLVICALLAPTIRKRAQEVGAVGLVDLIVLSHQTKAPMLVWMPVALVFVLRAAVQLGALGLLASGLFDGSAKLAIVGSTIIICLYLVVGGYRAAVRTDMLQGAIVVLAVGVAAFGLPTLSGTPVAFFDFAPYEPKLLVGIWLFLPWSALLAVDNWQRLTVASSDRVARRSYLCAALVCSGCYFVVCLAGYWSGGQQVYAVFGALMPAQMVWLATAMFVASIMSSIDTFIMPLVATMGHLRTMLELRGLIVALMALAAGTAIAFGDILSNIVAAFNSLSVFLPAAMGALYLRDVPSWGAVSSMTGGLAVALAITWVDINLAALSGFLVALGLYGLAASPLLKGAPYRLKG